MEGIDKRCPNCFKRMEGTTCTCGHTLLGGNDFLDQFFDQIKFLRGSAGSPAVLDPSEMAKKGAVTGMIDPKEQVQANGIDLTVGEISARHSYHGENLEIDFTNEKRKIPNPVEIFSSGENDYVRKEGDKIGHFKTDSYIMLNAWNEGCTPGNAIHCYPSDPIVAPYLVRYHEKVKVPMDAIGIVIQRSTLMRGFGMLLSSVWDSGYEGKGVGFMLVPRNTIIHKFARVGQIVFVKASAAKAYIGTYNKEGIKGDPLVL